MEYSRLIEMPMSNLLEYYNALNAVCVKYEFELKPLYNSQVTSEQTKWKEINDKLAKAKLYRNAILSAMQEKSFSDIDEYVKRKISTTSPNKKVSIKVGTNKKQ